MSRTVDHSRTLSERAGIVGADSFRSGAGLEPQQWFDVLVPPDEVARRVANLMPDHDRNLTLDELGELASAIAADGEIWEPMAIADATRRRYRLVYEDHRLDAWVLSWMPGQGTGFHDHDASGVGLHVAQGMVVEKQMLLPSGASRLELRNGDVRQGGPGYIHSAAWGEGEPAVSIHVYSPALVRVGQYRVDDDGILRRSIEHGRQELMDHTIAHVDPSRADG